MQFSQRLPTLQNLDINHKNIEVCEVITTKVLGLAFHNKLNLKTQIEDFFIKFSSSAYAFFKRMPILNINALLTAYN